MTDEIRSDLVIEVFCPPFWHQILFELPGNFDQSKLDMGEWAGGVELTLQISLLEEGCGEYVAGSIAVVESDEEW